MRRHRGIILTGVLTGAAAILLTLCGNPANMGFCIACFLRDAAGSMKLHAAGTVMYMRPEIAGLVLGALIAAIAAKEFRPRGGSSPMTRFVLGMLVMVGALMFLGCPLRMALRIGGGDLNAVVGLTGFAAGIGAGVLALNRGFTLRRTYAQSTLEGGLMPVLTMGVLLFSLIVPALFSASSEGPGSMHAPVLISLAAGLAVGAAAQRSRLCFAGGIRDAMMFRDFHLLWGLVAVVVTVLAGNLAIGSFKLGFAAQPIAHTDGVWNFLGMGLVGLGSVLLGGCPLRQLVMAGEGSSDAAITVLGLIAGAALSHNLSLASSAAGPTESGKIAVVLGLMIALAIALCNTDREGK